MIKIKRSVGDTKNGNQKSDVYLIQTLINNVIKAKKSHYSALIADGLIGQKTIRAIYYVQRNIVKMHRPDGIVDPEGRTIRILNLNVDTMKSKVLPTPGNQPDKVSIVPLATTPISSGLVVTYRKGARQILSPYTISIIKIAMAFAEIKQVAISSTLRTIEDQARIMYNDNFNAHSQGVGVYTVRGYNYGSAGKAVDKVFTNNVDKLKEDELKKKMGIEIKNWLNKGIRTSKHCVTQSEYEKNNILDIPYSSVPNSKRDEFEQALISLSNSVNKRKYSKGKSKVSLGSDNLINKIIVERSCWHIEIPQQSKKDVPK